MPIGMVKVESGLLEGVPGRDECVTVFRGVPYAAPPAGSLRFRPSQPPAAWSGIRHADRFSAICPQDDEMPGSFLKREFYPDTPEKNEDCLYLNIWTPAKSADENLPVFFWIHGGGMMYSYGSSIPFDGENLCKMGVVVVTINYRLNIFGLFSHPQLSAESELGVSGNYALLDQIAALRWVKKNIHVFGGNPDCVTIAGQSGGSRSVGLLLVSPLAKGLFHRAIAQSGSPVGGMGMDATLAETENSGMQLMERMGYCSVDEMRRVPGDMLFENYRRGAAGVNRLAGGLSPAIDGCFLPGEPVRILQQGRQSRVPLLTGCTTHEGVFGTDGMTTASYAEDARRRFGALTEEYLRRYPGDTLSQAVFSGNAARSDHYFAGHSAFARIHAETSGCAAYQYLFAKVPPGRESEKYGAFHTGELAYLFKNLGDIDRPWTAGDHRFSEIISQYWVNFAKTGDPNGAGVPVWKPCADANGEVMLLGGETGMVAVPDRDRKAFFTELFSEWINDKSGCVRLII